MILVLRVQPEMSLKLMIHLNKSSSKIKGQVKHVFLSEPNIHQVQSVAELDRLSSLKELHLYKQRKNIYLILTLRAPREVAHIEPQGTVFLVSTTNSSSGFPLPQGSGLTNQMIISNILITVHVFDINRFYKLQAFLRVSNRITFIQ